MKKVFLVSILACFAAMNMNAARGKFIHVDTSTAKDLKPQLAFNQDRVNEQNVTTLLVWTVNVNNYNEFSDASRILLRFTDGTAVRLNKVAGSAVQKEKFSKKNGNATISYYKTISSYEVTPEVIQKLQDGEAIIKVRVVFKENEAKDYDISQGYQAKMSADLLKSYNEAAQKNRQSTTDLSDEDF